MSPSASSILVLGVGNTLMGDDGAGVRLMQRVQAEMAGASDIEFVDAGTLSFVLLPQIQDCAGLLVLDAAQFGNAPGAVCALSGSAMDEFLRTARCSVHEVGIRDLLDLARLTQSLPERRAFIGIQPAAVGWSETLSAPVEAALPVASAAASALLASWCRPATAVEPGSA